MNTILIDDEEVALNALYRRVDWPKYDVENVYMATSIEQAKDIFKEHTIDFMLCDIEMPKGNGLEMFEWVKVYYPKTECIYITCHPEYEYIRKALQLGSADYLLKPINYKELDTILLALVQRLKTEVHNYKIPDHIILKVSQEAQKSGSETVRRIKQYIHEHIQETISIEDIAKVVYLSENYLMRLFKKEAGQSVLEYITNERIRLAKELLEQTDFSIKDVALSVGYGNYSYFIKIFKRTVGVSPNAYKKQLKS